MKYITISVLLLLSINAQAWDGTDSSTGEAVEIESGNLVRSGNDIEIYDVDSGEYKDVEVTDIRSNGSGAEVEVYDYESGEYRTLDMD